MNAAAPQVVRGSLPWYLLHLAELARQQNAPPPTIDEIEAGGWATRQALARALRRLWDRGLSRSAYVVLPTEAGLSALASARRPAKRLPRMTPETPAITEPAEAVRVLRAYLATSYHPKPVWLALETLERVHGVDRRIA